MFNFFKKKGFASNELNPDEASFISIIITKLSNQYPQFRKELELATFVAVSHDPLGSVGSFTYSLNDDSWKKICDVNKVNFDIQNIGFKSYSGEKVVIDLYTMEGLIFGYHTTTDIKNINLNTIDVINIWEKHFVNDDYSEIESLMIGIDKSELKKFNLLKNTFKIVVNNEEFYVLHDIGDGDYLVVTKKGIVFKITHDPFVIEKINDSLKEFLLSSAQIFWER